MKEIGIAIVVLVIIALAAITVIGIVVAARITWRYSTRWLKKRGLDEY